MFTDCLYFCRYQELNVPSLEAEGSADTQSCKLIDRFDDQFISIDADYFKRAAISKKDTWVFDIKLSKEFGKYKIRVDLGMAIQ